MRPLNDPVVIAAARSATARSVEKRTIYLLYKETYPQYGNSDELVGVFSAKEYMEQALTILRHVRTYVLEVTTNTILKV